MKWLTFLENDLISRKQSGFRPETLVLINCSLSIVKFEVLSI